MAKSERLRTTTIACACASLIALTGCSVDGSAHRGDEASAASGIDDSARRSATSSVETSPRRSSEDETTGPSRSNAVESTSAEASPGAAAKAWDMTCTDYNRLSPEDAKAVTAELGRRLNKKQLVENSRSWAIIKEFCKSGLVRNSQGVRDSG